MGLSKSEIWKKTEELKSIISEAISTIKKLPVSSQQHLQDFIQNATRYVEAKKVIEDYTQERD